MAYTDSDYGYVDTILEYVPEFSLVDSDYGYLDVVLPHEGVYIDSPYGTLDIVLEHQRPVDFWDIVDSIRVPMWSRGILNAKQQRDALKWGEFFPSSETTGCYDESILVEYNGNVVYAIANEVVENIWFRGKVSIMAPNIKFKNCKFTGPKTFIETEVMDCLIACTNSQVVNLIIEDSEIAPEHPNHRTNCINGHNFTLNRVNAHHGVDIVGGIGQLSTDYLNITIDGTWLHTMVMFNTPLQGDQITHNDLIQWHGLLNLRLRGTRMEAFVDPDIGCASDPPVGSQSTPGFKGNPHYPGLWGFSCVMGSPARKLMGGFIMTKCWIDGGAVGINFGGPTTVMFPDGGVVSNNWFGFDFRIGEDFGVLTKSSQTMEVSSNYRWNKSEPFNTSVPFSPRKNG